MTLLLALAIAGSLSVAGWRLGWLTRDGAIAAALVGTAVLGGAGAAGAALLALFFVSGSALTTLAAGRLPASKPPPPTPDTGHPGDPAGRRRPERAAGQVLANGFWPAAGAAAVAAGHDHGWAFLAGSLAAAQADTWATEIGAHARTLPRLVTTRRVVPAGTSGGVTLLGTGGGIAGAAAMAGLTTLVGRPGATAVAAGLGGVLGMMLDSALGATLQARYYCESCARDTERPVHRCGSTARLVGGRRWIDNDMVNLIAGGAGGLAAAALAGAR